ncbi:MAG TPA: hypothetical protein VD867_12000 [Burkholderiales bacterium]|nr:hypothetical protein [Burkholderiales bacterium]
MEPSLARTTVLVTAGLLTWAADFLVIYAFAAIACARGFHERNMLGIGIVPLVSAAATMVAASITAALVIHALRGRRRAVGETRTFVVGAALGAGALALVAIVLTGLPGLVVRGTCA